MATRVPPQTENLSQGVYDAIRERLILGDLNPGDTLSIRTLADDFDVSAMPVREALRQLASEEALIGAAKKAYRVPSLSPAEAANLFFVRAVLEGAASELAVVHMRLADIAKLDALAQDTSNAWAAGDASGYICANFKFHTCINNRAGNAALQGMIDATYARTGPWMARGVIDLIKTDGVTDGHKKIVDACASGNAPEVRRLVEEDAQWAFNLYQQRL